MPGQGEREPFPDEEHARRKANANQILDAALQLLQRWGYKKTTLDDIARQAGISKGTVYLHWKTREALFDALLLREWLSSIVDLRQRLSNDPAGATLSSLARHIVSIVRSNPLFRAMLLQDTEMLGDLTRSRVGQSAMQFRLEFTTTYLQKLRATGLLRTDNAMETQMKMIAAIFMGYFVVDQFLPPGFHFLPAEMAEALAYTLHRAVEPDELLPSKAVEEVTHLFTHLLDQLADMIERTSQGKATDNILSSNDRRASSAFWMRLLHFAQSCPVQQGKPI